MKARLLIYLFFFLITSCYATAEGFGVSPSSLEFTLRRGEESSRQLIIYNTGDEAVEFGISSQSYQLSFSPEQGSIPAGGSSTVIVTATGKALGHSSEEISMNIGGNHKEGIGISLGTSVPVSLHVLDSGISSANPAIGIILSGGILASGLAAFYGFMRKKGFVYRSG